MLYKVFVHVQNGIDSKHFSLFTLIPVTDVQSTDTHFRPNVYHFTMIPFFTSHIQRTRRIYFCAQIINGRHRFFTYLRDVVVVDDRDTRVTQNWTTIFELSLIRYLLIRVSGFRYCVQVELKQCWLPQICFR